MKNKINRKILGVIILLGFMFLLAVPVFAADATGIVPCGLDSTFANSCTLCHLITGIKKIFDYGLKIIVVITLACATFAGVMYIVSSGNEGTMESAKKFLSASLIGFAVVLGAWVMVNTTITVLMPTKSDLGIEKTSWYQFGDIKCAANTETAVAFTKSVDTTFTAVAGQSYRLDPPSISGGSGNYTWSADNLPPGLEINTSTGVVSGTPNAAAAGKSFTVTYTAKDNVAKKASINNSDDIIFGASTVFAAEGESVSIQVELYIEAADAGELSIPTTSLKSGAEKVPYTAYIYGNGGRAGYSWSMMDGYELPPGLSLKNTSYAFVEIYGTPTQAGTYTVGIKLTSGEKIFSKEFSLVIAAAPTSITIPTTAVYGGKVDVPYASTIEASVVSGEYIWSATGVPEGLNFAGCLAPICRNHAKLTGTPKVAGNYTINVTVTAGGKSASKKFELVIGEASIDELTIDTTYLDDGTINDPSYKSYIYGSGGSGSYNFSLMEGYNLPPGLSLTNVNSEYAVLQGTPTTIGTYTVGIKLTAGEESDSGEFELTIGKVKIIPTTTTPPTTTTDFSDFLLTVTPASLPNGKVGDPYTGGTIYGSGGKCPYRWWMLGADDTTYGAPAYCEIPPGLSLKHYYGSTSAILEGTPTEPGIFSVCIRLYSGRHPIAYGNNEIFPTYRLVIEAANADDLVITTNHLATGNTGWDYGNSFFNLTLSATGGNGTYTWSADLPSGLIINPSTGKISGSPAKEGTYTVKFTVTSGGESVSKDLELKIL